MSREDRPGSSNVARGLCVAALSFVWLLTAFGIDGPGRYAWADQLRRADDGSLQAGRRVVAATKNGQLSLEFDAEGQIANVGFADGRISRVPARGDLFRLSRPGAEAQAGDGPVIDATEELRLPGGGAIRHAGRDSDVHASLTVSEHKDYLQFDGAIQSFHQDLPFQATVTLPVDAHGWVWFDDLRSQRRIGAGETYDNLAASAVERSSAFPLGTIADRDHALTIAVPLDSPRLERVQYDPAAGLKITFDLAASPDAVKLKATASLRFIVFASDGRLGFRGAVEKYYSIFPSFFTRRIEPQAEGIWHVGFRQADQDGVPDAAYAKDYGLGLNQVPLGEVQYRNHGYFDASRRIAWDAALGIMVANHTNFWYYKFETNGAPAQLSDDEIVGQLEAAGRGSPTAGGADEDSDKPRADEARAAFASAARDRAGKIAFQRYGPLVNFFMNNDLAGTPSDWTQVALARQTGHAIERAKAAGGHLSALLMDGVAGITRGPRSTGWNAVYDYERSHWAAATVPLTYDHTDPDHATAVSLALANYVGMQKFARFAKDRGLFVAANMIADQNRPAGWFGADLVDYWGVEGSLPERATAARSTVDQFAMWKRALADDRPISTLQHFRDDETLDEFERTLQMNLFYDIYPGGISTGKASWVNDSGIRNLFARYIPVFKALSAAGWQPVQRASSSNADLWIERYGSWSSRRIFLAVRNETDQRQSGTISLEVGGGSERLDATDVMSGARISPHGVGATTGFELAVAPHGTSVIELREAANPPQ